MEVFVAAQAQKGAVALGHAAHAGMRQVVARADKGRRCAMFESAIAVADRHHLKHIAVERHLRRAGIAAVEKTYLLLADFFQIGGQAPAVAVVDAGDRHFVRHAASTKSNQREAAHFDRVVDQVVIAGGAIQAKCVQPGAACARQRGGKPPAGIGAPLGRQDLDFMRRVFIFRHPQEHAAAVEESV